MGPNRIGQAKKRKHIQIRARQIHTKHPRDPVVGHAAGASDGGSRGLPLLVLVGVQDDVAVAAVVLLRGLRGWRKGGKRGGGYAGRTK